MNKVKAALFYTLWACLLLSKSFGQNIEQKAEGIEQQMDSIFSAYNDQSKPGAAVAVLKNGELVFKKGYGSANLEYNIAVTPATIFPVASVSK